MLSTYLTKELGWTPARVAVPVFWGNILTFLACSFWGAVSERVGQRWALMITTSIALFLIPLYLNQTDHALFLGFFLLFICFFSGKDALNLGWLSERFPTEVRATASGFIYRQGAVLGAAVVPILTYFAVNQAMGFVKPMMYGSVGSLIVYIVAVYLGPETKGMVMTAGTDAGRREEAVSRLRAEGGARLVALHRVIPQCYHRDDWVMRAFGMEPRPPFPRGFEVEQGDWSLLDPVPARPKLYRAVH